LLYREKYSQWCENPTFDGSIRDELKKISDEKEIEDRFYKDLEFGTAGLRGIMGAGTNRMNRYTVGKATLGLGRYLLDHFEDARERGVVIGYDTRNRSAEFAENAAAVFTSLGIPVRLFDQPVPTPVLSFCIRHFSCVSGVVVTASHNPPQYNGYKAYDETGCQLGVEMATQVLSYVNQIRDWGQIPEKGNPSLVQKIGDETIEIFVDTVLSESAFSDAKAKKNLKLVYTPIHGSGFRPVCRVLEKDGFSDVTLVKEQTLPDGNFPTVKSPNPEERGALSMGISLAEEIGADLVIGTDPDADRIGCAVMQNGAMTLLSGNQVGALLVDFLVKEKSRPDVRQTVVTTIVTGDLGCEIAKKNRCQVERVLTGFRFIGEKITALQQAREKDPTDPRRFLMGYEESYGYLAGVHARDKDAVVAAMLICEMAAFYKAKGKSLVDALNELYREYGYFLDCQDSYTLQGKEGIEKISRVMDGLRADVGFLPDVREVLDYSLGLDGLPTANVLKFILSDSSWIAARPSGTEPKIKFYFCIRGENREKAEEKLSLIRKAIREKTGL